MRLINADKYCEFLNTYPLEKAQSNFMTFYRDALQHTFECEVKAIPIEFIEEYIEYQDTEEQKVLRMMWHAWELVEKENESNN